MSSLETILVTGAGGQLALEFAALAQSYPQYRFLFASKEQLPIEDTVAVQAYFDAHPVDYCINCAAYTAVDKAETERETAFLINGTAAGNLAAECKKNNTGFIHISTDYVFNGNGTRPYKETDATDPVNVYGASKLLGEELVLQNNEQAIIIRTSWVYSKFGNNFVKTMLRLMKERERINVVNDQLGCPTYAAGLATAIMQLVAKLPHFDFENNIFHYSDEGIISWYDFATAIKEYTGSHCVINPVPTTQYPTPAKRPHYSVLDKSLIKKTFGITVPGWKENLIAALHAIKNQA